MEKVFFKMILGDVIAADTSTGEFITAFLDSHTLIGRLPAGTEMVVNGKTTGAEPAPIGRSEGLRLWAAAGKSRFVIKLSPEGVEPDFAESFEAGRPGLRLGPIS